MSIREKLEKIKGWRDEHLKLEKLLERNAFVGLIILLAASTSFALGRLSAIEANTSPVRIVFPEEGATASALLSQNAQESIQDEVTGASGDLELPPQPVPIASGNAEGKYVASKSGTKYHLPWCSGAKRIKEENKIWFASKEEAEKKGYTPAGNCKGI